MNVTLSCECGQFQAIIRNPERRKYGRAVCMCDDCQAYAKFLKKTDKILDKNGGTEIIAIYPKQLEILKGRDQLNCMRLTSKGLFRWYTDCCHTPIANSPGPKMPYLGVLHSSLKLDEVQKGIVFGPINLRFYGKFGKGKLPLDTYSGAPMSVGIKLAPFIVKGMLGKKYSPNPFFVEDGSPIVQSIVLSKD